MTILTTSYYKKNITLIFLKILLYIYIYNIIILNSSSVFYILNWLGLAMTSETLLFFHNYDKIWLQLYWNLSPVKIGHGRYRGLKFLEYSSSKTLEKTYRICYNNWKLYFVWKGYHTPFQSQLDSRLVITLYNL